MSAELTLTKREILQIDVVYALWIGTIIGVSLLMYATYIVVYRVMMAQARNRTHVDGLRLLHNARTMCETRVLYLQKMAKRSIPRRRVAYEEQITLMEGAIDRLNHRIAQLESNMNTRVM